MNWHNVDEVDLGAGVTNGSFDLQALGRVQSYVAMKFQRATLRAIEPYPSGPA